MSEFSSNRRTFLRQSAAVVGASLVSTGPAASASPPALTDTHLYFGRWPFRTFPWSTEKEIKEGLIKRGVTQAWVASFEGILQRDLGKVNARLASQCREAPDLLLPVGSINPLLPDWQNDLRRCAEEHGMKVIRLHPNFHGYALTDPPFQQLMEASAARRLGVQIVAQMEDQRTQHPLLQVKPVDLKPLPDVIKRVPEARVMVLNANAVMLTTALAGADGLWLDFAMVEGVGGLEGLAASPLAKGLCFGSYAPVFYWEAARLKVQEAGLADVQMRRMMHENAAAFLAA
jgi:predicted TIM-barrel fold metal-dependent hydrolase